MLSSFREIVIGGVFIAPFVGYLGLACVIFAGLRWAFRVSGWAAQRRENPLLDVCVYLCILAALVVYIS
jgi:hypothetical protein